MARILSVEDSEDYQMFIAQALAPLDFEITKSYDVKNALKHIDNAERDPIDLVILDIMLPDGDAFMVMRDMQERASTKGTPVLLLTGLNDLNTKLSAFDLGAEDYLVKPIDPQELRARVQMRLRKHSSQGSGGLKAGGLILKPAEMSVFTDDAKPAKIELTSKEFKILSFLMQNQGKIFSRLQLVKAIWGEKVHVLDRTVDSHICGIRRRLGDRAGCLESLPNEGYRFNPSAKVTPRGKPRKALKAD
jgi:DNA-binding response OmpR family regulator